MLNINYGNLDEVVYNTSVYFDNTYLVEQSTDTYLKYSKSKLKEEYLHDKEFNAIINQIPESIRPESKV